MNKFSNLIIHKICNFLIDFNDLISLSLVSKTFREVCKFKIDDIKNDYEIIENIIRTPNITLKDYLNIKECYNFLNYNILNSWYKYGYYIFKSERQLNIPKSKKLKIKNINQVYMITGLSLRKKKI